MRAIKTAIILFLPIVAITASQFICGCCTRTVSIDGGAIEATTADVKPYTLDKILTNFFGYETDISALIGHSKTTNTNLISVTAKIFHSKEDESSWLQIASLFPSVCTLCLLPSWRQERWITTIYLIDKQGHTLDTSTFIAHSCIGTCLLPVPLLTQNEEDDYFRFDSYSAEKGYNVTKESFHFAKFIWKQARNKAIQQLNKLNKENE